MSAKLVRFGFILAGVLVVCSGQMCGPTPTQIGIPSGVYTGQVTSIAETTVVDEGSDPETEYERASFSFSQGFIDGVPAMDNGSPLEVGASTTSQSGSLNVCISVQAPHQIAGMARLV